jgi:hypothetical protein
MIFNLSSKCKTHNSKCQKNLQILLLFQKLSLSQTLTEKVKDSIENTLQNFNVIVNLLYTADFNKIFFNNQRF